MSQPLIIANSVTLNFLARVCNVKMTFTLTAFQTYVLPALQLLQEQMDALDASSMDVRNAWQGIISTKTQLLGSRSALSATWLRTTLNILFSQTDVSNV